MANQTFLAPDTACSHTEPILPENPTPRLLQLKQVQREVETKCSKTLKSEQEKLEELLIDETEKLVSSKKALENDKSEQEKKKRDITKHQRETLFYKDKLRKLNEGVVGSDWSADLNVQLREIECKRDELNELIKALSKYKEIGTPTNEALKNKVDDLKKARLSLDMTFADYS